MRWLNVLIVEDDDDMRVLYGYMLAAAGYHVKAVKNGLEALAEIQVERPDIVLTDVAMPVLSGIELIKALKASNDLASLPIVAMTSFGESVREQARAAGANDSIDKLSGEADLREVINRILAGSELGGSNQDVGQMWG